MIDLQAQFGNKWARIATYLPGRTDNDVKNFWSTRQKRLARLLQAQSKPNSHGKSPTFRREATPFEVCTYSTRCPAKQRAPPTFVVRRKQNREEQVCTYSLLYTAAAASSSSGNPRSSFHPWRRTIFSGA